MKNIVAALIASVSFMVCPAAKADIVTDWTDFGRVIEAGDDTPRSPGRFFAQTHLALAMFEAANLIDRRYESYLGLEAADQSASVDAAVMAAARDVLKAYYPNREQDIERSFELALSMLEEGAARDMGVAAGQRAAAAAMETGQVDPEAVAAPYRPVTTPGTWVPTRLPVFPDWYAILPLWSIDNPEAFMPPEPPDLASEEWARDFNEVHSLGGQDSASRTSIQSRIARYRITPVIMPTLRAIADTPGRSTVQNARMIALLYMATDDTGIITGNAKLRYNFWRPITAIRNADLDDNPDTLIDPDWEPYIGTPNHPEYPCAHCSWAAAVAEVLKAEVGNSPPGGVQVASRSLDYAAVQVVPTFDQWVEEVSFSRILGGVHYRFSNTAAEQIGRNVARQTLGLFQPIE